MSVKTRCKARLMGGYWAVRPRATAIGLPERLNDRKTNLNSSVATLTFEGRLYGRPSVRAEGPRSLRRRTTAERGRRGGCRRKGLRREDEREGRNVYGAADYGSNRLSTCPAHPVKLI